MRNLGEENVRGLDLGIKKLSTKILGCLPSPHAFNMIKVNRYDNREKYLEVRKKYLNRKNNRYLFTYLENRAKKSRLCIALFKRRTKPQNVLNISRDTSNMASDTLST